MEDIISKIESLRYDIETGIEDDVIKISVRLIEIRSNIEQLRQYNVSGQREQLVKFSHYIQKYKNEGLDFDCVEREVDAYLTNCH